MKRGDEFVYSTTVLSKADKIRPYDTHPAQRDSGSCGQPSGVTTRARGGCTVEVSEPGIRRVRPTSHGETKGE